MNTAKIRRQPSSKGTPRAGLFPLIVAFLALVTIVLFIFDTRPGVVLRRAAEKTSASLSSPVLSMLSRAAQSGTLTASGKGETITYQASLPERALLQKEGAGAFSLQLEKDSVYFSLPEQFSGARSFARSEAYRAWDQTSDLSDFAEEKARIRLFLALCDPAIFSDETHKALDLALDAAHGKARMKKASFLSEDGKEVSCRAVVYTYDSKKACAFLQTFFDHAAPEEMSAVYSAFYALQKKSVSDSMRQNFSDAFSSTGKAASLLLSAMSDPGAEVSVVHCIYRGKLAETQIRLTSPLLTAKGSIRFGVDGKAGRENRAALTLEKEGVNILSFSYADRIAEDTKKAYLAEAEAVLTDKTGLFSESEESLAAKIRFSFGKEKKDLGFRFICGDNETYFRGMLKDDSLREGVAFTLSAWEENRKNTLRHAWDIVIQTKTQTIPAPPETAEALISADAPAQETP